MIFSSKIKIMNIFDIIIEIINFIQNLAYRQSILYIKMYFFIDSYEILNKVRGGL